MPSYSSLVAVIAARTDPPVGKLEPDTEQTPHRWAVRVWPGRVASSDFRSWKVVFVRIPLETLPTEEKYYRIAPEILFRFSEVPLRGPRQAEARSDASSSR